MKLTFEKSTRPGTIREELSFIPDNFRIMHTDGNTTVEIFNITEKSMTEVGPETEEVTKEWTEYERVSYHMEDRTDEEGNTYSERVTTTEPVEYAEIVQSITDTVNAHDPSVLPPTENERLEALEAALTEVILNG